MTNFAPIVICFMLLIFPNFDQGFLPKLLDKALLQFSFCLQGKSVAFQGPSKNSYQWNNFLISQTKYIVGTLKSRLDETFF